ncbi:MAG: 50S ribosomal protein L29 [Promethearchaeota archaeon]
MPLLKMNEIRNMTPVERERKLDELRAELAKQRAAMMSGAGMENPGVIRGIRKNIARILTVNTEEARRIAEESLEAGE